MFRVVFKDKIKQRAVLIIALATVIVAVNAEHHGLYVCGNGCLPRIVGDGLTETFIRSVVNQNVTQWRVGDTVEIRNPQGEGAMWGRRSAYGPIEYLFDTPDAPPSGDDGSGGSGSGGGGGGSGSSPGPTPVDPPGGGGGSGGFPCTWIVTPDGGTCILIQIINPGITD
ncbi:MAG: hypothetical protein Tsb002_03620 [Wenzhouxiangellaceae bacterium]